VWSHRGEGGGGWKEWDSGGVIGVRKVGGESTGVVLRERIGVRAGEEGVR